MTSFSEKVRTLFNLFSGSDHKVPISHYLKSFQELWPNHQFRFSKEKDSTTKDFFAVSYGNSDYGYLLVENLDKMDKEECQLLVQATKLLAKGLRNAELETLHDNKNASQRTDKSVEQEAKERYRQIFEQSPVAIEIYDRDGRLMEVNKQFMDLFGLINEQIVLGNDLWSDKALSKENKALLANGQPVYYLQKTDINRTFNTTSKQSIRKGILLIDVYGYPLFDGNEITGYVLHLIEATEKAEAKAILSESEQRFSTLFQLSPIAGSLSSMDYQFSGVNKAWSDLFGYSLDEVLGKTPLEIGMITAETTEELIEKFKTDGNLKNQEINIINKMGETKQVLSSLEIITISGEQYLLSMLTDITARKNALKALEERNHYIETIFKNLPIGLALNTIDDGDVKFINSRFEEIYGWPKEILTNVSVFFDKVFPDPEFREEMRQKIMEDMTSGDPSRMNWDNLKVITQSGQVRYVHAYNIPIAEQNLMISTVQNVTERKNAENQLLDSLNEKETLLRELYHRTKNNMNIIQSLLSLKALKSRNEEVHEIITEITTKIHSMAMVHQMLYKTGDLSRINMKEYISELSDHLLNSFFMKSTIQLTTDLDTVYVLIEKAIPCGLILNELLTNAFKHGFPNGGNGRIEIKLKKDESGIVSLEVSDNGKGVPEGFDFRNQDSLGLQSIILTAESQLNGSISFATGSGLKCRISFEDSTSPPEKKPE